MVQASRKCRGRHHGVGVSSAAGLPPTEFRCSLADHLQTCSSRPLAASFGVPRSRSMSTDVELSDMLPELSSDLPLPSIEELEASMEPQELAGMDIPLEQMCWGWLLSAAPVRVRGAHERSLWSLHAGRLSGMM